MTTAMAPSTPIICLVQTMWDDDFVEIVQVRVSLLEQEAGTGRYPRPGLDVESCSESQIRRFMSQQSPQYLDLKADNVDELLRRKAEEALRTRLEEIELDHEIEREVSGQKIVFRLFTSRTLRGCERVRSNLTNSPTRVTMLFELI